MKKIFHVFYKDAMGEGEFEEVKAFDAEQAAEDFAESYWNEDPDGSVEDWNPVFKVLDPDNSAAGWKTFMLHGHYSVSFCATEVKEGA